MYNKSNLKAAGIASKLNLGIVKPELATVLFTGSKTVATDGYSLIEIDIPFVDNPTPLNDPILLNAADVAKIKTGNNDDIFVAVDGTVTVGTATYKIPTLPADQFPKYEEVLPTGEPVTTVTVNAQYLASLVAILAKLPNDTTHVKIAFYGDRKPLILTVKGHQNARAVLMPIVL